MSEHTPTWRPDASHAVKDGRCTVCGDRDNSLIWTCAGVGAPFSEGAIRRLRADQPQEPETSSEEASNA